MNAANAFPYFWLAMVAFIGLFHCVWTVHDINVGSTKLGWFGGRFERVEEPFYFWMTIAARGFGVVVACFMFWFGLSFLKWG